jgi:TM2 domain-containing membrane protein YozV
MTPGQLAALSLILPGAGQFCDERPGKGVYFFSLAVFTWVITLGFFGWFIHLCAALDAWHVASHPTHSDEESTGEPSNVYYL